MNNTVSWKHIIKDLNGNVIKSTFCGQELQKLIKYFRSWENLSKKMWKGTKKGYDSILKCWIYKMVSTYCSILNMCKYFLRPYVLTVL